MHRIRGYNTYARYPSPTPSITKKDIPLIFGVGYHWQFKKKKTSPGFLGKCSRDYGQKYPPPLPRESGNTQLVPLYIRVGGGGGGSHVEYDLFYQLIQAMIVCSSFPGPIDRSGYRGTPRLPGELAARLAGDRRLQAEPVHAGRREVKGRRPG